MLHAGAAYVPVDADDPAERADLVFSEAGVAAVIRDGPEVEVTSATRPDTDHGPPSVDDDAWIIFTSGSTGVPKGVAVTHRSAAAFVDAEAELFVVDEPIGPDDRVLAGLSVAFDASCEEMWLAWRHGACLVPAPRALVRTGMDLGPWLAAQRITIVSTVPTLATLWPDDALDQVRLLIFGGEACPPALVERVAVPGREVWNTYGPTEATVVACAAPLEAAGPVRIGLPLAGWDLEVVDPAGAPVGTGEVGELIIGGVGLARYLDPIKDAEQFAAMPVLGWGRAYRSGDLVERHPEGLVFVGRADEQVKVGGRRIELGEIDAALQALPGVTAAASAVQTTAAGNQVLVGYVVTADAPRRARRDRPAPCVPPGRAGAAASPSWMSCPRARPARWTERRCPGHWRDREPSRPAELSGTEAWVATQWTEVLGAAIRGAEDDFFELGGGAWPPRSWCRPCDAAIRARPSPTCTPTRGWPRWPITSTPPVTARR